MNSEMLKYHDFYNKIYLEAEKLLKKLTALSYNVSLNSFNNHYININGEYINQKYYMPVITIENKGDICFNIDGISFEFYVTKRDLKKKVRLKELLTNYSSRLNIYEFENCTTDIYMNGNNKEEILKNIENSQDTNFGISIDCSDLTSKEIIMNFNIVCSLLDI